jgi:hypothetical protein
MDKKTTICNVCGYEYHLHPVYEYDTWNLGHYGCRSIEQCPKRIKEWKNDGCPECRSKKFKENNSLIKIKQMSIEIIKKLVINELSEDFTKDFKNCICSHIQEYDLDYCIASDNCKDCLKGWLGKF